MCNVCVYMYVYVCKINYTYVLIFIVTLGLNKIFSFDSTTRLKAFPPDSRQNAY